MKKKDLILITAYCPTKEKKDTLLGLLKSLEKYREQYSILVASHTPLDSLFFEYFDYFYFDKNNIILKDIEYVQNGWFSPFNNYVIWSSYIEIGSTLKAIWDLVIPSISISKSLNYDIIHYIEYDSEVINDTELIENTKLLDEYDYIIYNSVNTHKLIGSFFSFKNKNIIKEHLICDNNVYNELLVNQYPKVPENVFFKLIEEQRTYYRKDFNSLDSKGIKLNKIRGNPVSWDVPFFDPKDNKLKFLSRNNTNEIYEIKVILDGTLYNLGNINVDCWKIIDLTENFNSVKKLTVIKNSHVVLEIDFTLDNFKSKFIRYNSALDNSSINIK